MAPFQNQVLTMHLIPQACYLFHFDVSRQTWKFSLERIPAHAHQILCTKSHYLLCTRGLKLRGNAHTFIHCKNTLVTLTTFSGCPSCVSVTKPNATKQVFLIESSLRSFSLVPLASLFFQKTYLATFLQWHFSPKTMQPCMQRTLPGQMCEHHMFSERRYHFLNFMCHTPKRKAIEVT